MILNNYITTYLVCSFLSLFIGIIAVIYGFPVWKKWDLNKEDEEQYRLEKKIYLIITVLSLGFLLRILMIPLWFLALHSMIISIPGAMCLVGVHNAAPSISYVASSLKLVLPAFYGYWLILNMLDRKVVTQPFIKQKLMLLTPLGIFILAETIFDVSFFFSTPPRQVSCCTSLFDVPRDDILQIAIESTWVWVVIFYILAIIILGNIIYFLIAHKKSTSSGRENRFGSKALMLVETPLAIFFFVVFVLALQTKISPLFLHLPFHHCIFCLCQEVMDALISFCMVFIGITLFTIYFWIVSSKNYADANPVLAPNMITLLKWSGFMLAGGVGIMSIHLGIIFLTF